HCAEADWDCRNRICRYLLGKYPSSHLCRSRETRSPALWFQANTSRETCRQYVSTRCRSPSAELLQTDRRKRGERRQSDAIPERRRCRQGRIESDGGESIHV